MSPSKRLTRRQMLRAGGTCLALPWLPSLLPRAAWGAVEQPPVRLVFWYVANGMHMADWRPSTEGADYDLPYILEPLAPIRSEVSVLSGLANLSGRDNRPGDHARGTGCFLTCRTPQYTGSASVENGVSIDQVVAAEVGDRTPFTSLQLGLEAGANSGQCDSGYPCSYQRSISWTDAYTPLPKLTSPRLVFELLFGEADPSDPGGQRRRALHTSILDAVAADATALQGRMGSADRRKLDQYLTGVRDVETRLQALNETVCVPPASPSRDGEVPERSRLMNELMALALECDITRTVTYMFANGGSGRSHTWLPGATGNHHGFSHHQGQAENHAVLRDINRWEIEEFTDFLTRLRAIELTDGRTLLDQSLVLLGSEISDGNRHNHDDLPVLLAGRGGDAVTPGRHLVFDDRRPVADLFLAMAQAAGVSRSTFGADGTTVMTEVA